jgi:serine/threonine-protein kinase
VDAQPSFHPLPEESEHRTRLQEALGPGYRLGELIGRGGFGSVYAAWDARLEREVAVKTIRPDVFPSPLLLARFAREARAAAQLRHPHIMPIFTVGDAEGMGYIIMPRIRGDSLRAVLERELLPIAEAHRLLLEVSSAFRAAHEAGLVHRDVKPENILLEGPERRAVLTDFGVVKALCGDDTAITGAGVILGTPAYLSPEQALGREIDHRADIYSLGIVAFEMLAGRRPFEGATPRELLALHLTTPAPDVRRCRADVPKKLASAVRRCLAKAASERWQRIGDFAAALGSVPIPAVDADARGSFWPSVLPWRRTSPRPD